jgi:UDP-N-acetyl-L-fucosamine synthase
MTGLEWGTIRSALGVVEKQPRGEERMLRMVADYAPTNVSDKVLRVILSYTEYVNRVVWRKA